VDTFTRKHEEALIELRRQIAQQKQQNRNENSASNTVLKLHY
jgi:hypothetical protein